MSRRRRRPRRATGRDGCAAGNRSARRVRPIPRITRFGTASGEQGASATRIIAPGLAIVIGAQHPLAVLEDRLRILHDRVGLQAAVLLGNAHRSARDRHAHAELRRLLDLDVDRVPEVRGKEIVMIGRGRAAGQHQFDQRHPDRDAQGLGRHAVPDALHRNEPGNELLAEACGMGARQRLVEVMMRVDEPRQHDMARGVERRIGRNRRRLAAPDAFDDLGSPRPRFRARNRLRGWRAGP